MISTATTKLEHPRPEDGTMRDLDPARRAARLHAGGVRIERVQPLRHLVHLPDGSATSAEPAPGRSDWGTPS